MKSEKKCCCSQGCCNKKAKSAPQSTSNQETKDIIKEAYSEVVTKGGSVCPMGGCCGGGAQLSQDIGYSREEIEELADANLGLGCGNSVNLGDIQKGETVLDLGSGAGLDCFLAARKVGPEGSVIGVDMTQAMIDKARKNAQKYGFDTVEFHLGDIEDLPVESNSIDTIMSNCVISLATSKEKAFSEAFRVLKNGGKMAISDMVLTGTLTKEQRNDKKIMSTCVGGAILKEDYLLLLKEAGFTVTILGEDANISQKKFGNNDVPVSSLKFIAYKK
jgi:SAM-dependent methyltransferase